MPVIVCKDTAPLNAKTINNVLQRGADQTCEKTCINIICFLSCSTFRHSSVHRVLGRLSRGRLRKHRAFRADRIGIRCPDSAELKPQSSLVLQARGKVGSPMPRQVDTPYTTRLFGKSQPRPQKILTNPTTGMDLHIVYAISTFYDHSD